MPVLAGFGLLAGDIGPWTFVVWEHLVFYSGIQLMFYASFPFLTYTVQYMDADMNPWKVA